MTSPLLFRFVGDACVIANIGRNYLHVANTTYSAASHMVFASPMTV